MPGLAAGLAAAAAVAGSAISAKMSSDSAEKQQKFAADNTFDKSGLYDPNKFDYGYDPLGAYRDAKAYDMMGALGQQRAASQADYAAANGYANSGKTNAAQQSLAAQALLARGTGAVPTVAEQQGGLQAQQLMAAQASNAASARGAAGLALANQTAASNTANGLAAIGSQTQINAGAERLNNLNAANSAYSNLRAGDLASQQQAAQQSQYNAQLQAQQRAQNDQYQLAQQQNAIGVRTTQLNAGIAQQGLLAGNQQAYTNASMAIQAQNSANQQAAVNRAINAVGQVASTAATMPHGSTSSPKTDSSAQNNANVTTTNPNGAYALPRAAGGPVEKQQPYLVGEEGPELVVPAKDGVVIPAGPTAAMMHGMMGLPARAAGGPIEAGGAPLLARAPVDRGVLPLYAPEGQQLRQSTDGRGYLEDDAPAALPNGMAIPSLSGGTSGGASLAPARAKPAPASAPKTRRMTPEEMMAQADRDIAAARATHAARMAQGPAVGRAPAPSGLAAAADREIAAMRGNLEAGPAVRRLADGTPANGYNTELTDGAERAYLSRFGTNSDGDYDLRGATAAGLTDGAKAVRGPDGGFYFPDHLPDTFKKPNHETFSNESQYAGYAPERAGSWNGDQYVPPPASQMLAAAPPPGKLPGELLQDAVASDPRKAAVFSAGLQQLLGADLSKQPPAQLQTSIQTMLEKDPARARAFRSLVMQVLGHTSEAPAPALAAELAFGVPPSTGQSLLSARAHGGPVVGRTPYLVGEQGPELVVPMLMAGRRSA